MSATTNASTTTSTTTCNSSCTILLNCSLILLDCKHGRVLPGQTVVVRGGRIDSVRGAGRAGEKGHNHDDKEQNANDNAGKKDGHVAAADVVQTDGKQPATVIDVAGLFLLPAFSDCHVHVTAGDANLQQQASLPPSLVAARAVRTLKASLLRGFTTLRDAGGADWGLAQAVEEGTVRAPRLLFCGRALSQTGGHGDFRGRGDVHHAGGWSCPCAALAGSSGAGGSSIGRVCDGDTEVRRAVRDEARKGAHHIKIMASGGVASPTDRLTNLQFSVAELEAIVEEANNAGLYVAAHAYSAAAIKRCLAAGIRSIEHGNLLDEECAKMMQERGAFLVPTLVTYDQIKRQGEAAGMQPDIVAKVGDLLTKGINALALAEENDLNICFGSDLLGPMQEHQLDEIRIRAKVQSPASILRSLTTTPAKLFNVEGLTGEVKVGSFADLLVFDMNPLDDVACLTSESSLKLIMKDGCIVKNILDN